MVTQNKLFIVISPIYICQKHRKRKLSDSLPVPNSVGVKVAGSVSSNSEINGVFYFIHCYLLEIAETM